MSTPRPAVLKLIRTTIPDIGPHKTAFKTLGDRGRGWHPLMPQNTSNEPELTADFSPF